MNFETSRVSVPLWLMFVFALLLLTLGCAVWFYFLDANDAKTVGLVGGLITGLVVFILTFVASVRPLVRLDRYDRMGIRNILINRHEKSYYAGILSHTEKVVKVMGASCTRFVDDFLDKANEDQVLVAALRKHSRLSIQLLIPDEAHIAADARARWPAFERKLTDLKQEFAGRVELRRFPNNAHHSFVIADDNLIAGPIFDSDNSKHGPAVHVVMSTKFAQKYDDYFDTVWTSCAAAA